MPFPPILQSSAIPIDTSTQPTFLSGAHLHDITNVSGPFLFGRVDSREHCLAQSDQPGVAEASSIRSRNSCRNWISRDLCKQECPLEWKKILRIPKKNRLGFQPLDEDTIETFDRCLQSPGNEPSIQGVIVITLVNLHNIMRSPTTHGGLQCQFNAENPLPMLPGMV